MALATGPGLLPGLLEPLTGQPDPVLTVRLGSPGSVGRQQQELD
jgi:hypothetical protein